MSLSRKRATSASSTSLCTSASQAAFQGMAVSPAPAAPMSSVCPSISTRLAATVAPLPKFDGVPRRLSRSSTRLSTTRISAETDAPAGAPRRTKLSPVCAVCPVRVLTSRRSPSAATPSVRLSTVGFTARSAMMVTISVVAIVKIAGSLRSVMVLVAPT